MKRRGFPAFIALLTAFSLLFGSCLLPEGTDAMSKKRLVYVALGDSIATGFGLPGYSDTDTPPGAYAALTRDYLSSMGSQLGTDGVDYYNWAVNGMTSGGLLQMLNTLPEEQRVILAETDVITLSIGSNDLLLPFVRITLGVFGVSVDTNSQTDIMLELNRILSTYTPSQIGYLLIGLQAVLEDNEELNQACNNFGGENGSFQQIIRKLKELAPEAEIFAINGYNPYYGVDLSFDISGKRISVLDMNRLSDQYIRKLNTAFSKNAEAYTLVSVFDSFNRSGMTNVSVDMKNPMKLSLDPHPSAAGHQAVADRIRDKLIEKLGLTDLPWMLSKVKVTPVSKTMTTGKKAAITVTLPKGLKKVSSFQKKAEEGIYEVKVAFKSSKPSVAAVSPKGRISAKKTGKTTVTVTASLKDGTKQVFRIPVTVKKAKK